MTFLQRQKTKLKIKKKEKAGCGIGSLEKWHVTMSDHHLDRLRGIYCHGYAGVKIHGRLGRLAGKAS